MTDIRRRVRILIVDDSLTFRTMLSAELSKKEDFEVVAFASDPYEAQHKLKFFNPDVMVLDIILPKMDGVEYVRRLMSQYPIPIVVISAINEYIGMAIKAGAIDGVVKPQSGEFGIARFVTQLADKIIIASKHTQRLKSKHDTDAFQASHNDSQYDSQRGAAEGAVKHGAASDATVVIKTDIDIIAIGASTGGTNAIAAIMSELPPGLPGIVIVQHMPADFTDMFAKRLDSSCAASVYEARSGDKILPGTALVAPGGYHFKLSKSGKVYTGLIQSGEKVNGHCPSVDVMFSSVAEHAGNRAIGVLLTGMGGDGAKGLLEMKKAGAKTIGQDEGSSVVYGMPKVAHDIGAVERQVPLGQIAARIVSLL